ncbi:MAG: cache domain-containing protein, partial [Deltaproteobacteria bacterium]|nr:cache domain-containing protein [Deltaproteobacteria bacterium]
MSGKLNGIFARVLIAAVGPLLVACFLLMGGINGIVRGEAEDLAEEAARHLGAQISVRVGDMLSIMVGALDLTRRNLEFLDPGAPDAQAFAGHILRAAIDANPSVYAAWFSFERGAFSSSGRFWRGYVRERDGIASMPAPPDSQLDDRRLSPWYNRPFSSGTGYFQGTNQYYDTGGHFYTGALVFPVKRGDRVIGCVGIDIRYDTLLKFLRGGGNKRAITLLTMGDEELYTTREDADDFTGSTPRDFLSDALDEENFASYYTKGAKSGKEHYVCLVPLVFGTEAAGIETPRTGLALRIETPTAYLQGLAADVGKGIIALGVIVLLSVVGVLFPVTLDIT